jgi:hypothetical protein
MFVVVTDPSGLLTSILTVLECFLLTSESDARIVTSRPITALTLAIQTVITSECLSSQPEGSNDGFTICAIAEPTPAAITIVQKIAFQVRGGTLDANLAKTDKGDDLSELSDISYCLTFLHEFGLGTCRNFRERPTHSRCFAKEWEIVQFQVHLGHEPRRILKKPATITVSTASPSAQPAAARSTTRCRFWPATSS